MTYIFFFFMQHAKGETSGRVDDNLDSIKKRFAVFKETSLPVIEYYEKKGKVEKVESVYI